MEREKFGSRLGFILISAGCAIGLGNVWRFPYITGKDGGAAFILIYLLFLVIFGIPIMSMEFAVGRASKKSIALGFDVLEPKGTKWHLMKYLGIAANYLLMMFYTVIAGWMLAYLKKFIFGEFEHTTPEQVSGIFAELQQNPAKEILYMVLVIAIGFRICALGLQKGVERITKMMMVLLFAAMIVLVIRVLSLDGAAEGIRYYLVPDFSRVHEIGLQTVILDALGQAFFTLSIGVGSMQIFGSYIGKEKSLFGESIVIASLDTLVAILAGFIIIPSCFAFGIDPGAGPSLIFITLPNVFEAMPFGRIWGICFFLFMTFAALSTVIAVFENIVSINMELSGKSRKSVCIKNIGLMFLLALPCALGFSVLNFIQPFGAGTGILDLEDFIMSNNFQPIGALFFVIFCTWKYGWGWDNFEKEVNTGSGFRLPKWAKFYLKFIVPLLIIYILVSGYISFFA